MFFFVKAMISLIFIFLLSNDIMFNRKRNIGLKIIEFIVCIALISYIFVSGSNYVIEKNNIEEEIKNNEIISTELTVYNIDGSVKETTSIGDYMYKSFVSTVFDGNTNITDLEFLKNNLVVIIFGIILIIYWITLLLLFEKEEEIGYKIVEDEILFEKYNPMIAACISQNRNVMCRDVVAIIINLIEKGKINLRYAQDNKKGYRYMISENPKSDVRLDMIEKDIYDWIFQEIPNFLKRKSEVEYISINQEGIIEIDLIKRIKELSQNEDTYGRLKELNHNVKQRLNRIGANEESVPFILKLFNNFLVWISVALVTHHIISNGLSMEITNLQVFYMLFVLIFAICILPIIYLFSLVCFEFIRIIFKTMQQVTEGYTGRRLIAKSVSIIFGTLMLIIIYVLLAKDFYILYDILLLGITCLIIFTDDYMLKHQPIILNDYYNLKRIENKIEEYSLMDDKNIEYVELWDKYYAYSVALGIPKPLDKEIDVSYENTNIITEQNLEGLYWVSKSYLEGMGDMEFSDDKNKIDILKFI